MDTKQLDAEHKQILRELRMDMRALVRELEKAFVGSNEPLPPVYTIAAEVLQMAKLVIGKGCENATIELLAMAEIERIVEQNRHADKMAEKAGLN